MGRLPSGPRRGSSFTGLFVALIALLAVGGIIVFGIMQLVGGDDGDSNGGQLITGSPLPTGTSTGARPNTSPTATATAPSPTASATPSGPGPTGRPYSFSNLQSAWQAKSITTTLGGQSSGFTGMATTPYDVRLTRSGDVLEACVLVYPTADAVSTDWELATGEAPSLKSGRTVPSRVATWWNGNVVILVKSRTGTISTDTFDAFISLS